MDVLELADEILILTAGILRSADMPEAELSAARKEALKVAGEAGLSPEDADRLADEAQQKLGAFADALVVAREAAQAIKVVVADHEAMLQESIRRVVQEERSRAHIARH